MVADMAKMMELTVELFGPARRLSGERQAVLEVRDGATLRDVVAALAERYPGFVGSVIEPECRLADSYLINYNGKRTARSLDETPEEGDHLLILPVDAGG
jgi:molybdopterin converting factor small subunit